jgi:hypothetical protein
MNTTSVNQSYLHALGERLTAYPALSGALGATDEVQASAHADQTEQFPSDLAARAMAAARSPELDHLRQKRMMVRIAGEITP